MGTPDAGAYPARLTIESEFVTVVAASGDTYAILRAQEGSSGAEHAAGATLVAGWQLPAPAGGASILVDNGFDPPAPVSTLMALGAQFSGEAATLVQAIGGHGDPFNGRNEQQGLDLGTTLDGGTFSLRFRGATTAPIAWDATNQEIADALAALSTVGADNLALHAAYYPPDDIFNDAGETGWYFIGDLRLQPIELIEVVDVTLTADGLPIEPGDIEAGEFTVGAPPNPVGLPLGVVYVNEDGPAFFENFGTAADPIWRPGPRSASADDWTELALTPTSAIIHHGTSADLSHASEGVRLEVTPASGYFGQDGENAALVALGTGSNAEASLSARAAGVSSNVSVFGPKAVVEHRDATGTPESAFEAGAGAIVKARDTALDIVRAAISVVAGNLKLVLAQVFDDAGHAISELSMTADDTRLAALKDQIPRARQSLSVSGGTIGHVQLDAIRASAVTGAQIIMQDGGLDPGSVQISVLDTAGLAATHMTINVGGVTIGLDSGRDIRFVGLPTSAPVVAGALWNDGGTLKITA